jgi:indole-3-glycerol phosphate synthase
VERTARLMSEVPAGVTVVSESGIAGADQLRELQDAGVDAVLVGELLMRSADPEAALRALRGAHADRAEGSPDRRAGRGSNRF